MPWLLQYLRKNFVDLGLCGFSLPKLIVPPSRSHNLSNFDNGVVLTITSGVFIFSLTRFIPIESAFFCENLEGVL